MFGNKQLSMFALLALVLLLGCCPTLFADESAPTSSGGKGTAAQSSSTPTPPESVDLTPPGYKPGDPMYDDPEVQMGRAAADDIAKSVKFSKDKALVERVEAIGAKIAVIADTTQVPAGFGNDHVAPYHYTYHVIDSPEVNAFSLPGGFIYIYTGMIKLISTDDELAGVLGHETAHAAHHHVSTLDHEANKMSNSMMLGILAAIVGRVPDYDIANIYTGASYAQQGVLNNTFSEAAEEDADHTGMIFMKKAGFNPVGMLTMLERLELQEQTSPAIDEGFLQDHPLTPDRVAAAKVELASLGVPVTPASVRQADGLLQVAVTPGSSSPSKTVMVTVSGEPFFSLAAINRSEAVAAAATLDGLLNGNVYAIKADGPNIVVEGQTLVTITQADAAAQPLPSTPDQMATDAAHALRLILFNESVTGINSN